MPRPRRPVVVGSPAGDVPDHLELPLNFLRGWHRPEHLRGFEGEAARWAHDGMPIDTALKVVHDRVRMAVGIVSAPPSLGAGSGEARPHARTVDADLVVSLLDAVTAVVARAYMRQSRVVAQQYHTMRPPASVLLEGRVTAATARQYGFSIAEEYWTFALLIPRSGDNSIDKRAAELPPRGIRAELGRRYDGAALSMLSADGGTVLLPTALAADQALDAFVAELACAAGVPVTAAVVRSATGDIPGAAECAHELLALADCLGLSGRLHRFDDLALEYQLSRPGPGLEQLRALLNPLDDHPDLFGTLQCFIAADLNRQRTATRLNLHPNTVDYRLRRIGELTGLQTAAPSDGLWLLRSALIARLCRTGRHLPGHESE